jgi:hypothetical protein
MTLATIVGSHPPSRTLGTWVTDGLPYSRAEALADGLLVDVTETAREAGFLYPVALTRAAWELCVALSPPAKRAGNDDHGRLWDVLMSNVSPYPVLT